MRNSPDTDAAAVSVALAGLIARAVPGIQAVYLFGSAAQGRLRRESDLDLGVLAASSVPSDLLAETAAACARQAGRDVDLVDIRQVPLILQAQIVGAGRRLAGVGDSEEAARFENVALSRYCAFIEERRLLTEEIVNRRAIYAA